MKVLLIKVDGKLPNRALMVLSTWHKQRGDTTVHVTSVGDLMFSEADEVYSSSIFTYSEGKRQAIALRFPNAVVGGDGYKPVWSDLTLIGRGIGSNLREVIKDQDPDRIPLDYTLYPNFTSSLGYSSRGCRLDCAFCRMKTREGEIRSVISLREIWRGDPWPKHIFLLDNDFFGQEEWRERIQEAKNHGFKVCFNQGINIRLINEEQAKLLSEIYYADDSFTVKRLYTAWDNLGDERVFKSGIETIVRAGIPSKHLMVYMLVGFHKGETIDEVLYRFNEIAALGCRPYPMVFDKRNKELTHFQRWAIRRYYEFVPWKEYGRKSQIQSNEGPFLFSE